MQSERTISSGVTTSIYSPLNRAADEIRLLTLGPCRPGHRLECTLEKASLQDFRSDYTAFILSNGLSSNTRRQAKEIWAASTSASNSSARPNSPPTKDPFLGSVPEPDLYRFNWGDFASLSYVWGDESLRQDIILNGEIVSITANLADALRTFTADEVFTGRYKLWVDAICINQVDDGERSHQVQKMREIYGGAWTVISWIGGSHQGASIHLAFPFLRTLASLEGDKRDLRDLQEPLKDTYLYALHNLMEQRYWFRLWIIQELVMGAPSTVIRFGDEIIDWNTFWRGISVLYHGSNWLFKDEALKQAYSTRGIRGQAAWQTYSIHLVHSDLRQLTRSEEEGKRRLGFRRLLDIANSTECRDVRDKVFALVGMMDSAIAADIMKAYELEPPRLFAAVSRAFIAHTNGLDPLRQGNPWGGVGTPSWAADWTWDGRIRFSRPEYSGMAPHLDVSEPEPDPALTYCAHGHTTPSYGFLDDWRLLQCEGFVFDGVAGLGAPEAGFFNWDEERVIQCPSWKSSYGSHESTGQALWKTLLLSVIAKGERAVQRHAALLRLPKSFGMALPQFDEKGWDWMAAQAGYYFKWENWHEANDHLMLGDWSLGSFFNNFISDDVGEATYAEVYLACQRAVQQRRFMLTEGGYFGWGPDNAYSEDPLMELRVGDKIAIIFGCSTPLVIRPKGDKFEVVGEAYVQGFMDGEALGLLESGACEVQIFTFC
jgi:hypothetical protein